MEGAGWHLRRAEAALGVEGVGVGAAECQGAAVGRGEEGMGKAEAARAGGEVGSGLR